ncbi:hypothetical protein [Corynebacterium bouchesdurhonense]|nr:hypothetical protein [Corynebacterium bouchesdurhonense]
MPARMNVDATIDSINASGIELVTDGAPARCRAGSACPRCRWNGPYYTG